MTEGERERVCVCMRVLQRKSVCERGSMGEEESTRERVCVCVYVCLCVCVYESMGEEESECA